MPGRTLELGQWSEPNETLTPLCHIVTPVGMMGYGFDEDVVEAELVKLASESVPTAIILDAGSTDSGPSKLALGIMTAPRDSYKRDLTKLIRLIDTYKVPLLFSSAGGDGSNAHVDEMRTVIEEIVSANYPRRKFKVLSIYAELPKQLIKRRLNQGLIAGCGSAVPALTANDIDDAPTIVAQMGCEPFLDAMFAEPDFDILIGGRAYDPAPYVAYAAYQAMLSSDKMPVSALGGKFLGGAFHMGKIMECGGLCSSPKSQSAKATVYKCGAFDITPLAKTSRCTPLTVAAHTLYEKSRPDLLYGPGGCLDLTSSRYEQLSDNKSVRPRGGIFRPLPTQSERYTVKLEGARIIGYRTVFMGSFRDPILIGQLDYLLDRIRQYVSSQCKDIQGNWKLDFHKYGGSNDKTKPAREVFIVGEALADTQALANSVASSARIAATHGPYPGQKATSGNLAFGLGGKNEFEAGPCAEFCIYHVMELEAGEEGARDITNGSDISSSSGDDQKLAKLFAFRQETLGRRSEDLESSNTAVTNNLAQRPRRAANTSSHPNSQVNGNGSVQAQSTDVSSKMNEVHTENTFETLGSVASVLRSKNAGPFEVTMDVMFDSPATYQAIKDSNLLDIDVIARLFAINVEDVIYCGFFDQALAFKATIPRMRGGKRCASGGFMEDDVHGSGQYLPLMSLRLPEDLANAIKAACV